MISVLLGGHRFQLRAAAVIVHGGHVLLHRLEDDGFWALPGGRVEPGESASTTVCREMQEELDEAVDCGALLYTVENFFEYGGQPNHEIGLYFQATLPTGSRLFDKTRSHAGVEGRHRLEFRWFPVAQLGAIDVQPRFLRTVLARPEPSHQHVVQQG